MYWGVSNKSRKMLWMAGGLGTSSRPTLLTLWLGRKTPGLSQSSFLCERFRQVKEFRQHGSLSENFILRYTIVTSSLKQPLNDFRSSDQLIFFSLQRRKLLMNPNVDVYQVPEALAHHCLLTVVSKMHLFGRCLLIESHFARGSSPWSLSLSSPQVWRLKMVAQIDMKIRPEGNRRSGEWKGGWLA